MNRRQTQSCIAICEVCKSSSNMSYSFKCNTCRSQSEMKAKKELENLRENLDNFAGQLYEEKEFVDVKIVCNAKTFDCHKAVLSCRSKVF